MKYAIALIASLAASAVYAAPSTEAQACEEFAEATRLGTEAGNNMYPVAVYEELTRAALGAQPEMYRLYMSAFLMGYSGGLLGGDPNVSFVQFYTNCMSEGV